MPVGVIACLSRRMGKSFTCRRSKARTGMSWTLPPAMSLRKSPRTPVRIIRFTAPMAHTLIWPAFARRCSRWQTAKTHTSNSAIGPFSAPVRPFTINAAQTFAFCCVNELLGFEVGDISSGKMIHRVTVPNFEKGPVKRHGCPSHGVGLTPDESEVWVSDGANNRLHIFDKRHLSAANAPPYMASIELSDQPGWVTFSLDGKLAYPSTGDVIDVATRKIIAHLTDETGTAVQSEKLLELDFVGGVPVRAGDQFGIGRAKR
jgi:hypothetical protein